MKPIRRFAGGPHIPLGSMRGKRMIHVGNPGLAFCRKIDPAVRSNWRPYPQMFTSLLAALLLTTLGGAVSALEIPPLPPPVFPPPVSDNGLTSYGTYSRASGGAAGPHTALVNILSGNLVIDPVDLAIAGRGVSVVLERFYNAQDPTVGVFGPGWSSFPDARLDYCTSAKKSPGSVRYVSPSGADYVFAQGYQRTQGLHASFSNHRSSIIHDNGIEFRFGSLVAKDCLQYLVAIVDRNSKTITIERDTSGAPTKIIDSLHRVVRISGAVNFGTLKIVPPGGLASIAYAYVPGGITVTRGDQTTRYRYGEGGIGQLISSIQDPRGFLTKFTYETSRECQGRIQKIDYAREPGTAPTTFDTYTYDTCSGGSPNIGHANVTDPNGNVTKYQWDRNDAPGPTMITDALDRVIEVGYDLYFFGVNDVRIKTDSTNSLQAGKWDYDYPDGTLFNFVHHFDENDLVTHYEYSDSDGQLDFCGLGDACNSLNRFLPTAVTNPERNTTKFEYDERGNLTKVTNANNVVVATLTPNRNGTIKKITLPRGETSFDYRYAGNDGEGALRKITVTDPLNRSSQTTFDPVGRINIHTSAAGKRTRYSFDGLGRPLSVVYEDGSRVNFNGYDGNNNLLSRTDSTGTTSFEYDHRNRVVQKSSPLGTVTYIYDSVGNLTSKTDAGGTVSYEYDAVNQLSRLIDHGAVVTYSKPEEPRDENNRSHKVTYPHGLTVYRDWDGAGRMKGIKAVAPTSEMTAAPQPPPGPAPSPRPLVDLKYTYYPNSTLLAELADADGTGTVYSDYYYDHLNQLNVQTMTKANFVDYREWQYDNNNNRISQTIHLPLPRQVTCYTYDKADQLFGTSTPKARGACEPDAFSGGDTLYSYDEDGNLTSRGGSNGLKLDYDAADHTIAITPPLSAGGAAAKLTMKYTGLDQTQRTSVKRGTAPATTFAYDGTGIGPSSARPGTAGATPDFFTRTPGGRLVSLHRGNNTFFYILDRLDSVVALTDFNGRRGEIFSAANRYRYSAWGEILPQPQSFETVPQPFKFAGAEYEPSTGLYKMGARYYDPTIGRFTQLDPLGGGYRYALNNPVNLRDPTGYDTAECDVDESMGEYGGFVCTLYPDAPDPEGMFGNFGWFLAASNNPMSYAGVPAGSAGGSWADFGEQVAEVTGDVLDILKELKIIPERSWGGFPPIQTKQLPGQPREE
jgi:RHS repeat-associated protein